ncbi:telomere stability and silencing-domain-containing protein [Phycomyces nitens]|nr:telomere stability and silencing-domain-containing protein [Phycomyces nitens]
MMAQAIVNLFAGLDPVCVSFDTTNDCLTIRHLKEQLAAITHIDPNDQRISSMGGRPFIDNDQLVLQNNSPAMFNMDLRLLGGKGGFGSMLRAQGGRMNAQKTTNFEACRDLQGRRIKTVNDAKK